MIGAVALLLATLLQTGAALGAFETLPMSAPADRQGWCAIEEPDRGAYMKAALSQPGSLPGVGWGSIETIYRTGSLLLRGEIYHLTAAGVYAERSANLRAAYRGAELSLRFWESAWTDVVTRSGLAWGAGLKGKVRGVSARIAADGLPFRAPDLAAPRPAAGASMERTLLPGVVLRGGARFTHPRASSIEVGWSPAEPIELCQSIRWPGQETATGATFRLGRGLLRLSWRPDDLLGQELGVLCGWRLSSR